MLFRSYVFMKQARLWELHYAKAQPDPEADRSATAPQLIRFAGTEMSEIEAATVDSQQSRLRAA